MIIAFMGIDGSGKTTLAKRLKNILEEESRFSVEYYYIASSPLQKLFWRKKLNKRGSSTKVRNNASSKLWPYLVFLDCIVVYMVSKFLKKKKIVIFDRYFYDLLISYEYSGYSNKIIRKLFLTLPKPDLAFLLDVSPDVAYERKSDSSIEYYKIQRDRYLKLAYELRIRVISTENSVAKASSDLFDEIRSYLK